MVQLGSTPQAPWLTTELTRPPFSTQPPPLEPCFMLQGTTGELKIFWKPMKGELQRIRRWPS